MNLNKLILLGMLTLACFISNAQVGQGRRAAWYADFDTLTSNLKAISPHLQVKKNVWKYDALKKIAQLRRGIDTVSGSDGFELLINQVLTTCQDGHTSLMNWPQSYLNAYHGFSLWMPVIYMDGQYIMTRAIKQGPITIDPGSRITAVDGIPIDRYVQGLTGDLVMRYDVKRRKFYSENFYQNQQLVFKGHFVISVKTAQNKKIELPIDTKKRLDFVYSSQDTIRNQVSYWSDLKVLYIRLYRMDNALIPNFQKKIAAFRKSQQPVDRIIIDLRDNGGGNDIVWQKLYEAILPAPVHYPLQLDGLFPSKLYSNYLRQQEISRAEIVRDSGEIAKKFNFYRFYKGEWGIIPSDTSLKFNGKVIILGSEYNYSSGASAFKLAQQDQSGKIFLISRPTGTFLGTGYAPIVLQLPHSKISYRIEPVIEVTGCKSPIELMHDQYPLSIPWSMQEVLDRASYRGNTMGETFLKTKDPFVLRALSL